jgi:positive regulator of sigma E activity
VEPVRVKVYGLFPTTRRRYVVQLVVAAVLVVVLLVVWTVHRVNLRPEAVGVPSPGLARILFMLDLLPWLALGLGVLQGIEAYFVLRAFARKQAEQTQTQPVPPS